MDDTKVCKVLLRVQNFKSKRSDNSTRGMVLPTLLRAVLLAAARSYYALQLIQETMMEGQNSRTGLAVGLKYSANMSP